MLYYNDQGEGPVVVLIHGWGLNRHVWTNVSTILAQRFRVLSVDLPGHGNSPATLPFTLEALAADVAAVIDTIGGKASVVGWSLGGMVALQLAIRYPDKIQRLATLATSAQFVASEDWPFGVKQEVLSNFSDALLQDHRETVLRFLAIQSLGSEHAKTEIRILKQHLFTDGEPDRDALLGGLQILQTTHLQTQLARICCPVLMVVGKRDSLVNSEACYRTAAAIADCKILDIAEAGHAPFISHPQILMPELEAFLTQSF